jgi:hypothetical protein
MTPLSVGAASGRPLGFLFNPKYIAASSGAPFAHRRLLQCQSLAASLVAQPFLAVLLGFLSTNFIEDRP